VIVFVNTVSYICSEYLFVFYGNYGKIAYKKLPFCRILLHIGSFDFRIYVLHMPQQTIKTLYVIHIV
jgi:hypothetical protein